MIYDQSYVLSSWTLLPRIDDLLQNSEVIDIQCPEYLLPAAEKLVHNSKIVSQGAAERLRSRVAVGDKLNAANMLAAGGVHVPLYLDSDSTAIDAATKILGIPLVVKPRLGAAGRNVATVRDVGAARLAASHFSAHEAFMFQEFIDGQQLGYCAVFDEGIVAQAAGFENIRYRSNPTVTGGVRTLYDLALFELGRKVVALIGGSGLIDLDVLRDQFGRDYVIDVNLRAGGSAGALLGAGIDLIGGYLNIISEAEYRPNLGVAEPGCELPFSLRLRAEAADTPNLLAIGRWFVIASHHHIRDFGIRYWLNELLCYVSS